MHHEPITITPAAAPVQETARAICFRAWHQAGTGRTTYHEVWIPKVFWNGTSIRIPYRMAVEKGLHTSYWKFSAEPAPNPLLREYQAAALNAGYSLAEAERNARIALAMQDRHVDDRLLGSIQGLEEAIVEGTRELVHELGLHPAEAERQMRQQYSAELDRLYAALPASYRRR